MSDELAAQYEQELTIPLTGGTLFVDPDCIRPDPLPDIAERLRDDLEKVRATLKQRRQDKDDLFAELRLLVKAEEVLVSALRPFDRKRKAK